MTFSWVRPADKSALSGRPLADIGTGDGQTLLALAPDGIGLDRSMDALSAARRSGVVRLAAGCALALPVQTGSLGCVLAADLFHHLPDDQLRMSLAECRRVLRDRGCLVAWWYERSGRGGVGDPAYPRELGRVMRAARIEFDRVEELELEISIRPAPSTVGLRAWA
jgi:SAM-dependent methyltransferase